VGKKPSSINVVMNSHMGKEHGNRLVQSVDSGEPEMCQFGFPKDISNVDIVVQN
jgi:hypothetical protein